MNTIDRRDWFAGMAISGYLSIHTASAHPDTATRMAKSAYALADAMIAESQMASIREFMKQESAKEWGGGEMPDTGCAIVEYVRRDGNTGRRAVAHLDWEHLGSPDDIMAYRELEQ